MIFHWPKPVAIHDYLYVLWFAAMLQYVKAQGIPISIISELDEAKNDTVLVDTEYLNPETISILKNNRNKIVGFNLVDSSYIAQPCREYIADIDLIFSFTGIQTTNIGHELEFDDQFQPVMKERKFLPDSDWSVFNMMRMTGRLLSLPYVHWEKQPEPGHLPKDQKSGKVLIRGGAHFRRVVLAFFLLRSGMLDENSGFALRDFFGIRMNSQFRFCDECRSRFSRSNNRYTHHVSGHSDECTSPAKWGNDLELANAGSWNNRCPRSFYWLADKFEQAHGPLNPSTLENLFNADFVTAEEHHKMLRRASFTADLKWLHSIYAAQRFWDGAICGTVNLLPNRTMDQDYFPMIQPGQHYIPFNEGEPLVDHDFDYAQVQNDCWALYTEWIRPGEYGVNSKMLGHITDRINAI